MIARSRASVLFLLIPLVALPAWNQIASESKSKNDQVLRFPVAHEHTASWCLGYLYVSKELVRFEVNRPEHDKKHSFEIRRSELQPAHLWLFLGQEQNAVELKFGRSTYHFWLLPNEQDVSSGRPYRFNPQDALPAQILIDAVRDFDTVLARSRSTLRAVNDGAGTSGTVETVVRPDTVLVAGNPALTEDLVNRTSGYFAWLLETPITNGQKATMRELLVKSWRQHNSNEMNGALQVAEAYSRITHLPVEQQKIVRERLLPDTLKAMREQRGEPILKELIEIYDASHRPIAPGTPALTRQMTDAYLEVILFIRSVSGEQHFAEPTSELKEKWARAIAQHYPEFSQEQKEQLAKMPLLNAAMSVWWNRLPEAERASYKQSWREQFASDESQAAQSDESQPAQSAASQPAESAVSQPAPSAAPASGSSASSQELIRRSMEQHQSYMDMMNFSMKMHYSRMNSINILGGNPYLYVNAYGNPY